MKQAAALASVLCFALLAATAPLPAPADPDQNWPQWRGPRMTGVAPQGNPPVEWSDSKNIKWKIEIPGKGSASPIVWGDRIFVLTAIPTEKKVPAAAAPEPAAPGKRGRGPRGIQPDAVQQFAVIAVNRKDGKILWQKVVREELPHEGTHPTGTWASNSAVTDGEHVYAFFGSRGLYALDMNGNLKWEKDFGDMTIRLGFGEGASPAVHGDKIVVTWDHEGDSFIVALDKRSGKEAWRVPRDEGTAWTTPLIVEANGATQVITSATRKVRSYDLATGKLLWETAGMTANAIPTPVTDGKIVYLTSGFRGNALMAVNLDAAKGNLASTEAVLWKFDRDTPYVPSPLLYDGKLYFMKTNSAIVSCFDAATGKPLYGPERIEGMTDVYASPVGAAGRVYVFGRDGVGTVLAHGPEFKVLAQSKLDDGFDASPAIVGNEMYIRGRNHLYRISAD